MRFDTPIVAFGGGHGLSATLQALRHITRDLTAVVTVADDGGSSGRLRDELGIIPPGDLRMALAALCDESEWGVTWRDTLQHRFSSSGPLDNHALGNLLIATLWDRLGDPVAGLDWVGKLLRCQGRVLPLATAPVEIEADVAFADHREVVRGQAAVAVTTGRVDQVRIEPTNPPVPAQVFTALERAEWIVLGPGSWYTSVLPHLLVEPVARALVAAPARRALVLNLAAPSGETAGLSAPDHLLVLRNYCPELRFDVVIADPTVVDDPVALAEAAHVLGAQLVLRQVSRGDGTARHDPLRLAAALRDGFTKTFADVGHPN